MYWRIVCGSVIFATAISGHALAGDFWSNITKATTDCCGDYVGGYCCDDYCPKPPPCPKPVDCFLCDDYCYKCLPCVPVVSCYACDDYCPKCPPVITCPPKHLLRCGPVQECCPAYEDAGKGKPGKSSRALSIRLPAVRLPAIWASAETPAKP